MSSIIKVDQIQDSGGNNLVTSNGSGVITSAGFGKIGQVVSATDSTQRTTTSTSYVTDSNTLTANITPTSTSSKILVMLSTTGFNSGNNYTYYTIYRDSCQEKIQYIV